MSDHQTRKCWQCGEVKPLDRDHFYFKNVERGRYHAECIPCDSARRSERYAAARTRAIEGGWRPYEKVTTEWDIDDLTEKMEARTVADEPFGFSAFHGPAYPSRRIA